MSIEIKMLQTGDSAVLDGIEPGLFERPLKDLSLSEFLFDSRHHMAIALYKPAGTEQQQVVGFASAVHYVHPDKDPELFINEIEVAESHRNHGLGKQLLQLLFNHAHDLGCTQAWVLTEPSNTPAMHLYASINGVEAVHDQVMFTFKIDQEK
jgi:ribosomal protein S18 acetylase RimI-like enzyme